MDTVVVLMSTYNGEKYIKEQIDSILNQENVDVKIYIRDDGSTDSTVKIIEQISDQRIILMSEDNVGYTNSFNLLLRKSPEAEYYAFSDQDDVWLKNKLYTAIKKMNENNTDLYCSNVYVTNEKLEITKEFSHRVENYFNHESKILNSGAQGCTMVFTYKLKEKILSYSPAENWPYDYWMTTVALYTGKVWYDNKPYMYYRQHSNNVTGGDNGFYNRIRKQLDSLKRSLSGPWSKLAYDLISGYYKEIEDEDRETLNALVLYKKDFKQKIRLLIDGEFKKNNKIKNLFLKVLVLFNRV